MVYSIRHMVYNIEYPNLVYSIEYPDMAYGIDYLVYVFQGFQKPLIKEESLNQI